MRGGFLGEVFFMYYALMFIFILLVLKKKVKNNKFRNKNI